MFSKPIISTLLMIGLLETANAQQINNCSSGYFPPGTYQRSCWNCDFSDGEQYLSATCSTENNRQKTSKLDLNQNCTDIANNNGTLACN
jgi:hypothetical protein